MQGQQTNRNSVVKSISMCYWISINWISEFALEICMVCPIDEGTANQSQECGKSIAMGDQAELDFGVRFGDLF